MRILIENEIFKHEDVTKTAFIKNMIYHMYFGGLYG